MGAAVAVLLIKERHIVEAFQAAGATSPERGQMPDEIRVDTSGMAWSRLRSRAIIAFSIAVAMGLFPFFLNTRR